MQNFGLDLQRNEHFTAQKPSLHSALLLNLSVRGQTMPKNRTSLQAHSKAGVHVWNKNEGSWWPPAQELAIWYG